MLLIDVFSVLEGTVHGSVFKIKASSHTVVCETRAKNFGVSVKSKKLVELSVHVGGMFTSSFTWLHALYVFPGSRIASAIL